MKTFIYVMSFLTEWFVNPSVKLAIIVAKQKYSYVNYIATVTRELSLQQNSSNKQKSDLIAYCCNYVIKKISYFKIITIDIKLTYMQLGYCHCHNHICHF